jgi:hypothetical protein
MQPKDALKHLQELERALKGLSTSASLPDLKAMDMVGAALEAVRELDLAGLKKDLDGRRDELEKKLKEELGSRREALLKAAEEAKVPTKRVGDSDRVGLFKVSYPGKKVRVEIGSEKADELEESDGRKVFARTQELQAGYDAVPFERESFFRQLRRAYRLALADGAAAEGGFLPIRTVYTYLVVVRQLGDESFVSSPDAKHFTGYTTPQFVYDLARFGKDSWTCGDESVQSRTPSMKTSMAKGKVMFVPKLADPLDPGFQISVLKIEKREVSG